MRPILTASGEVPALRNLNGSAAGNLTSPWSPPLRRNRPQAISTAHSSALTRRRNSDSDLLRRRLGGAGPHHADLVAARRMPGDRLVTAAVPVPATVAAAVAPAAATKPRVDEGRWLDAWRRPLDD